MSLWAILMPSMWRRQNNYYAWRWSTYDFEQEETRRPQFKATTTRYRACSFKTINIAINNCIFLEGGVL
jgi:hypothetical protein